jgi:hypothetical protein
MEMENELGMFSNRDYVPVAESDLLDVGEYASRALDIDESHQLKAEEESSPQPIHTVINFDPASVRNIWFYLRPDKEIPSDEKIKAMGFELVSELYEEVKASILNNNTKLAKINKERPDAASEKLAPFSMSEKTLNSL